MYIFLLGRNPKLSRLELAIYFQTNSIKYKVVSNTDKYLIINFNDETINFNKIMKDLAGIIKIAKVNKTIDNTEKIDDNFITDLLETKYLDNLELKLVTDNKFNYSLSSIGIDRELRQDFEEYTKDYFKTLKSKAVYKRPKKHSEKEINEIVNPDNYYSWSLNDNGFELFVIKDNNTYYCGNTIACFDPKTNITKDKNKPSKKILHNTSIRIADIMINLLALPKNKTIVDPFCGSGTFLAESMLKGYNVIGIDKSKDMYYASRKNLRWIQSKYNVSKKYTVLNMSSSKAKFKADAAVFEPYMGPFLNKLIPYQKAKRIVKELNHLYFEVFNNLYTNLNKRARVVCILPEFKTSDGKILKLSKELFCRTGFRLVNVEKINTKINLENPVEYSAPGGSKINRHIFILEKLDFIKHQNRNRR